jgi:hypothetical protein
LKVIRGGAVAGTDDSDNQTVPVPLRDVLVERARARVQSGYYERTDVRRRLVDVLWDEFYSR